MGDGLPPSFVVVCHFVPGKLQNRDESSQWEHCYQSSTLPALSFLPSAEQLQALGGGSTSLGFRFSPLRRRHFVRSREIWSSVPCRRSRSKTGDTRRSPSLPAS